jgi:capsular polysaccharide biosynthesis protein
MGWIRDDNPSITCIGNATLGPFSLDVESKYSYISDCVYDNNGTLLKEHSRNGGQRGDRLKSRCDTRISVDYTSAAKIGGSSLFIGNVFSHYGHFITETISRCWPSLEEYDHFVGFPVAGHNMVRPLEYHKEFFVRLGIDPDRIILVRESTVCARLHIPQQLWIVNDHANRRLRDIYARIRSTIRPKKNSRVFFSRGPNLATRIANTQAVQQVFAAHGFTIQYPERLPVEEQLAYCAGAEFLGGFSGSALHNCLFSQPGIVLAEVGDMRAKSGFLPMQAIANELAFVNAHRFDYCGDDDGNIDIDRLSRWLKSLDGATGKENADESR